MADMDAVFTGNRTLGFLRNNGSRIFCFLRLTGISLQIPANCLLYTSSGHDGLHDEVVWLHLAHCNTVLDDVVATRSMTAVWMLPSHM